MSITDKLPEAPKGYRWSTGVSAGRDGEIYGTVALNSSYGAGIPVIYVGSLYATSSPTEEGIVQAAEDLLKQFREREEEERDRHAEQDALNEQYAHLITD